MRKEQRSFIANYTIRSRPNKNIAANINYYEKYTNRECTKRKP